MGQAQQTAIWKALEEESYEGRAGGVRPARSALIVVPSLALSFGTGNTMGGRRASTSLCLTPNLSLAVGTGNCFYVSMPAGPLDSSSDPSEVPTNPSQPDSLPAWQTEPRPQRLGSNEDQRRPGHSPPSLALRDVGLIFRTIEQLTLKLNRLKVRETGLGSLEAFCGVSLGALDPGLGLFPPRT